MPLLSSKPSPCLAWRTSAASSPLSRDHVSSPGKPFSTRYPEWRLTDLPLHLNHLAPFRSHLCLTSLPSAPNALATWLFLLCVPSKSPHRSLCACSRSLQQSAPVFTWLPPPHHSGFTLAQMLLLQSNAGSLLTQQL